CLKDGVVEWPPSLQQCSACALSSYVRSIILTDERFLHFQLRQDRRTYCSCPVPMFIVLLTLTSGGFTVTLWCENALPNQRCPANWLIENAPDTPRRSYVCAQGRCSAETELD